MPLNCIKAAEQVGPTPPFFFSLRPCFLSPSWPADQGFPHMEARVLEGTDVHSNLTLTGIWDAAKVTLELGYIPRFFRTGTVRVRSNLDSLVSSYFPHSSTCFAASLRHFPKLFLAYSLSLVVICSNTLFVQQFRLDCMLPFDTREDIDVFFSPVCVSLIAVLSCGFLWDLLCFFKSKSHSLHNDHSYLEYFSVIAKCACCMLLCSQSCHSVPYSSFSNSTCPLLEPHNFFFHIMEFSKPLSEEDIRELRMSHSIPCTKYTLQFVHWGI